MRPSSVVCRAKWRLSTMAARPAEVISHAQHSCSTTSYAGSFGPRNRSRRRLASALAFILTAKACGHRGWSWFFSCLCDRCDPPARCTCPRGQPTRLRVPSLPGETDLPVPAYLDYRSVRMGQIQDRQGPCRSR
ncbi:hypothetical protein L1887_55339 [Cichorium endivia]|nr:hypothetical protein L1887_55339 [Cichorium endivia]